MDAASTLATVLAMRVGDDRAAADVVGAGGVEGVWALAAFGVLAMVLVVAAAAMARSRAGDARAERRAWSLATLPMVGAAFVTPIAVQLGLLWRPVLERAPEAPPMAWAGLGAPALAMPMGLGVLMCVEPTRVAASWRGAIALLGVAAMLTVVAVSDRLGFMGTQLLAVAALAWVWIGLMFRVRARAVEENRAGGVRMPRPGGRRALRSTALGALALGAGLVGAFAMREAAGAVEGFSMWLIATAGLAGLAAGAGHALRNALAGVAAVSGVSAAIATAGATLTAMLVVRDGDGGSVSVSDALVGVLMGGPFAAGGSGLTAALPETLFALGGAAAGAMVVLAAGSRDQGEHDGEGTAQAGPIRVVGMLLIAASVAVALLRVASATGLAGAG